MLIQWLRCISLPYCTLSVGLVHHGTCVYLGCILPSLKAASQLITLQLKLITLCHSISHLMLHILKLYLYSTAQPMRHFSEPAFRQQSAAWLLHLTPPMCIQAAVQKTQSCLQMMIQKPLHIITRAASMPPARLVHHAAGAAASTAAAAVAAAQDSGA